LNLLIILETLFYLNFNENLSSLFHNTILEISDTNSNWPYIVLSPLAIIDAVLIIVEFFNISANKPSTRRQSINNVVVDDTNPVIYLSLCDVISMDRIKEPVKGVSCQHYQAFDKQSFINCKFQQCPICNSSIPEHSYLIPDAFFMQLLQKTPVDCLAVEYNLRSNFIIIRNQKNKNYQFENIFPSEWSTSQQTNCDLKIIPAESQEFQGIANRINSTLPNAKIIKIESIQNKYLWTRYYHERKLLRQKNQQDTVEKMLFHGSRGTDPRDIYNGEDGFDMRFSASGMWGQGVYFAENASYSNGYVHICQEMGQTVRKFFLASVLVGDPFDCPSNAALRMPPEKAQASSHLLFHKVRYDCCSGFTGGSKIFIIYMNGRAYPKYLITFTLPS